MDDWYCSEATEIAGNLPIEILKTSIDKAKKMFPETIRGFLNAKPASYRLGFSLNKGHITMSEESVETFGDVMTPEEKERWKRSQTPTYHLTHDLAFLLPFHNLAMVTSYSADRIKLMDGKRRLHELGYMPVISDDAATWNNDARTQLLKTLRRPELPVSSLDPRAREILETLVWNIRGVEAFNLAEYRAKHKHKNRDGKSFGDPEDLVKFLGPVEKLVEVRPEQVDLEAERMSKGLPLTRAIGISSKVKTKDGIRHIPMIDFNNDCYQNGAEALIKKLQLNGLLVDSGKAWHFYGFDLMTENEWMDFTTNLKECYEADSKWAEFSILKGFSLLRITPGKGKLYQPCAVHNYQGVRKVQRDTETQALAA